MATRDKLAGFGTTALRVAAPLAGYMLADDDHKTQGAIMGGVAGLMMTPGGHAPPPVPNAAPPQAAPQQAAPKATPKATPKAKPKARSRAKAPVQSVQAPAPAPVQAAPAPAPAPAAPPDEVNATTYREMLDAQARREIPDWDKRVQAQAAAGQKKAASVYGVKLADLDMGLGVGVPGTPFNVGVRANRARLEGMKRWAPIDMLERAYENEDEGVAPEEQVSQERSRGLLLDPTIGAGMGAALAHYDLPVLGKMGKGPAAGLGALTGLLYNRFTADDREKDMQEAIKGVSRQKRIESAREAPPLLLSRGEA